MLTVNHKRYGIETIYQTTFAQYNGDGASVGPGGLSIDNPDPSANAAKLLQDGEAFVMNDAGATVARYVLPESPRVAGCLGTISGTAGN